MGDEAFFRKRFRDAILEHLVPADLRDFSFFEFDLAETDLAEDSRPRPYSLADGAVSGLLRARREESFWPRIERRKAGRHRGLLQESRIPTRSIVFVADHISIPADVRRMEMQDKERYQRIRETMGQYCGIVELARVEEGEAVRWISDYCAGRGVKIDADGARELVDALGGDMMMISNELEKLILYVGEKKRITLGDVETMVLAAKQRSLYELTDAISSERPRARSRSSGRDSDSRAKAKKPPSVTSICWRKLSARCW